MHKHANDANDSEKQLTRKMASVYLWRNMQYNVKSYGTSRFKTFTIDQGRVVQKLKARSFGHSPGQNMTDHDQLVCSNGSKRIMVFWLESLNTRMSKMEKSKYAEGKTNPDVKSVEVSASRFVRLFIVRSRLVLIVFAQFSW